MKKFLMVFTVFFAVATAFAVTAGKSQSSVGPGYHWFDANGDYIDFLPLSVQEGDCDGSNQLCARGYTDFDEVNGKIVPAGTQMAELEKP